MDVTATMRSKEQFSISDVDQRSYGQFGNVLATEGSATHLVGLEPIVDVELAKLNVSHVKSD